MTRAPAPAFVPPPPYPSQPPAEYVGEFWYGTDQLWTMLRTDATWSALPRSADGYGQKVFWWSADFSAAQEPQPELTVSGKRLDDEAGPLVASSATNATANFGQAMLVGVRLPTAGCWEITGHHRGRDLSFVVQVTP